MWGGDGDYGLSGSQEADVITLGAGASTVYAEGGNDRVSVGAGASLVDGGEGNDTLTAASGTHMIEGGGGDDTILLESGAATISGGAGDDLIVAQSGGAHVVYMAELGWEEFIFTRDASGALIVTAPDVYGMAQGQDTLIRVESIQINDLSGDLNALFASSAQLSVQEQMLLTPDLARNALVARIGVEDANAPFGDYQSFSFVDTQGGLSALEASALLRVRPGGSVAWLQLLAPDLLAQYAQDIAITLRATGRDGLYTDLRLSLELEAVAPVYGSEVAEIMAGSAAADNLRAGAGNDVLRGSGGADTLDGGTGRNRIDYGRSGAGVLVDLASGTGRGGDAEGDVLRTFAQVVGSAYGDELRGSAVSETFWGGAGDDLIFGGAGNDVIAGGLGADTLDGGEGQNTVSYAAAVTVDLAAGAGTAGEALGDVLLNISHLIGSQFSDWLIGNFAANTLSGGLGDDTLDGGAGNDVLRGGLGADVFVFALGSGRDRIRDFSTEDRVLLDHALLAQAGAQDLADVLAHHASQTGASVTLQFGADALVFDQISLADLAARADQFGLV